jgi:hypothetical protein
LSRSTATGHWKHDSIYGADGVLFWCPCGYGKPEFPLEGGRPHAVIVSFANPQGCDPAPADAGSQSRDGGPSRWTMAGTGLSDLTLSPSIAVGTPECWHGYVQNGEVT